MKLKQFQRIEIFWLDSCHTSGWRWVNEFDFSDTHLYHKTIGYFLQDSSKAITVCQSFKEWKSKDGDTCVDSIITIPKKAVIKIVKL